jgi:hypothetical protein
MTLQIIIHPSKSASLNITWTDIWSVLGDALLAAKQLHIVCRQPERLVRLFMLEEAEWLGVGQACNEAGLFMNEESVSGDRKTRELLQPELIVTASKHTVEEIDEGISAGDDDNVTVWKLVDERFLTGFGPEAKIFSTTKAFSKVEVGVTSRTSVSRLHSAAKSFKLPAGMTVEDEVEEAGGEVDEVERSGEQLTEDTIARHLEECRKSWAPEPKDLNWDGEGSIAPADNKAVMKWLG